MTDNKPAKVITLPGVAEPNKKRRRKTKRSQGSAYQRNGRWYIKFRVADPVTGVQSRPSEPVQGATSRAEALLALDHRLASIADGTYFAPTKALPVMFDEVAEELVAWARAEKRTPFNYEIAIENARATFGGKPLSAMTTAALESFRTQLVQGIVERRIAKRARKVSEEERRAFVASARATCNRRMTVLRRMFNRLVELERITEAETPFKRGKLKPYSEAENARTRYYSLEEIACILAAATEPFRSYVALALNTGLRRCELLNLDWSDWDEASSTLRARFTKGGKPRSVPVNANAAEILRRLQDHASGSHVFTGPKGERFTKHWASSAWRRVVKRAGIPNARLHDCRHSFASYLVNRGVELLTVQKLLGHSSSRLTERYSHLARGTLHEAAETMDKVFEELPEPARDRERGLHSGLQGAAVENAVRTKTAKGLIGAPGFEPGTSTVSSSSCAAERLTNNRNNRGWAFHTVASNLSPLHLNQHPNQHPIDLSRVRARPLSPQAEAITDNDHESQQRRRAM